MSDAKKDLAPLWGEAAPDFEPTNQQHDIIRFVDIGTGNGFVEALAGTGKTTTCQLAAPYIRGNASYCVFNRRNADEAKPKFRAYTNIRVGTFHSFGNSAWRRVAPSVQINEAEKRKMMLDEMQTPPQYRAAVSHLISLAKQSVVYEAWEPDNTGVWSSIIDHHDVLLRVKEDGLPDDKLRQMLIQAAMYGIDWSRRVGRTIIDFDDMLWLPLIEDAPFYTNDWVVVDEAQDTNPARRMIAERMLKQGGFKKSLTGRMLWVGDRHQAIYGFTGADANAVDRIIGKFQCQIFPLTLTYRCSRAAVAFANQWVPGLEAAPTNQEGQLLRVGAREFERGWMRSKSLLPGDAILCRNNRPLIRLAFDLIKQGIGCHIEGRDIGKRLATLASKFRVYTVKDLELRLEEYRNREIARLLRRSEGDDRGSSYAIDYLNDTVESLLTIMEGCQTVAEVETKIERMFRDTEPGQRSTVTLSTIHKAKGREWDRVFILGMGTYLPSRNARQAWQIEQEDNLCYVAATRTKGDLVLVDVEG